MLAAKYSWLLPVRQSAVSAILERVPKASHKRAGHQPPDKDHSDARINLEASFWKTRRSADGDGKLDFKAI